MPRSRRADPRGTVRRDLRAQGSASAREPPRRSPTPPLGVVATARRARQPRRRVQVVHCVPPDAPTASGACQRLCSRDERETLRRDGQRRSLRVLSWAGRSRPRARAVARADPMPHRPDPCAHLGVGTVGVTGVSVPSPHEPRDGLRQTPVPGRAGPRYAVLVPGLRSARSTHALASRDHDRTALALCAADQSFRGIGPFMPSRLQKWRWCRRRVGWESGQ